MSWRRSIREQQQSSNKPVPNRYGLLVHRLQAYGLQSVLHLNKVLFSSFDIFCCPSFEKKKSRRRLYGAAVYNGNVKAVADVKGTGGKGLIFSSFSL